MGRLETASRLEKLIITSVCLRNLISLALTHSHLGQPSPVTPQSTHDLQGLRFPSPRPSHSSLQRGSSQRQVASKKVAACGPPPPTGAPEACAHISERWGLQSGLDYRAELYPSSSAPLTAQGQTQARSPLPAPAHPMASGRACWDTRRWEDTPVWKYYRD